MHVHFEQNISTRTECTIHSLSWMGKVPDSLPEEAGAWKLNRTQYYLEGWLASGNAKGVVGVTFTTSHCKKYEAPSRSNFNLRGHRSEVILVSWNEPYQKLATCDSQGIIFVWIKHEGRWSIELINDRNSQVTDFAWSHDGRMALICYCDGFVLVGSVAGQRYWSSMLNLDNSTIACGVWTPDDQKVMFGTSDGQIIVMSSTGAMLTQVTVQEGMEITAMIWSCEKFNMDETQANRENNEKISSFTQDKFEETTSPKAYTLAVCFKYGAIYLMTNYDDLCPRIIHTLLTGLKIDWSNCGECLAVGGFTRLPNLQCRNELHFYSKDGQLKHWVSLPSQGKPLTALTWGHNDRRLFISAGFNLFVAWVTKHAAPLQFICQRAIQMAIQTENNVERLPLPNKLRSGVKSLYSPTIKSYIPDPFKLREFVSSPPPGSERLYCTMVRHGDETSGGHYTLYLEYMGGLIPLLKGKRASKLRPDFVIFDPKIRTKSGQMKTANGEDTEPTDRNDMDQGSHSGSDSDVSTDGCGSPRLQRKRRQKFFRPDKVERSITFRTLDELLYNDSLPESNKLVEVTSNIWGTKFRIQGIATYLPEDLGNVLYKTSLLHLQPRQMTITVTEICPGERLLSRDPNFTPAGPSEDESEVSLPNGLDENMEETISLVTESGNSYIKLSTQTAAEIVPTCLSSAQQDRSSVSDTDNACVMHQMITSLERQHKSPNMKKRSLSPATDSLAQNNHAFHVDPHPVNDATCFKPGTRPKIHTHMQLSVQTAQSAEVTTASVANHVDSTSEYANVNNTSSASNDCIKRLSNEVESIIRSEQDTASRWADPAFQGIKYIDEDIVTETEDLPFENNIVCDSSQLVRTPTTEVQKRLYLAPQLSEDVETQEDDEFPVAEHRGSIDSSSSTEGDNSFSVDYASAHSSLDKEINAITNLTDNLPNPFHNGDTPDLEIMQTTSLPASPIKRNSKLDSPTKLLRQEVLKGKCKHYSPIFTRKSKYSAKSVDSSDEDITTSVEEMRLNHSYKNLESFQKAQMKQKLRRARSSKGDDRGRQSAYGLRQFMVHNKAPLWNENSQVYQLDFGGRVTQESAKNFQIEFRGKQVMQFGRIDSNAYTLDFQYPFTALQAFAVALANVTQRLK